MPELPDVAGFKQYLDATSLHQRIETTRVFDDRFVKSVSRQTLQRRLKGAKLTGVRRWGKWLLVSLDPEGLLLLHFGMTGQLQYNARDEDLPEHTRLALLFETGSQLAVISRRLLGQAGFARDVDAFAAKRRLGPDALDDELDAEDFLARLADQSGTRLEVPFTWHRGELTATA